MEVIKKIIFIFFIVFLSGCFGNEKMEKIKEISSLYIKGEDNINLKTFSRNDLENINYPIIEVRTDHILKQVLFLTISERKNFRNYISGSGQSLTMNGAAITKTNGFDAHLVSLNIDKESPLLILTEPTLWTKSEIKEYSFLLANHSLSNYKFNCQFEVGKSSNLFIIDQKYNLTKIIEKCTSENEAFNNYYWVDNNGFVWKSKQWISPKGQIAEIYILQK